ncbi:hypothetical protein ANCCAN_06443 [Ancylostoma caninum]|uniref:Uncharacterized protein n=1 Tax=Ancylostoma caninum TaxID=29170 RepID=A0A368GWZ4_ANCCA|nr:hypothetical protein ANCCAN_06443 [Ancylostoma caninum]
MSRLLALLPLFVYAPSCAEIIDPKQSVVSENQFDISPQSISVDSIGQVEENSDMFMPAATTGDIFRYPLSNFRSPGYPMMSPYNNNMAYLNRFNIPYNRLGYVSPFNRPPFTTGQLGMYPRFNQYPWRSAYASIPTDSDLQFSYLMTHPQAAMTYQNLAYN